MGYIFCTSEYDVAALTPEVSKALEKRAEDYSRQRVPGIWKLTDRLPKSTAPNQMTRGRRIYRRVIGVILIAVGLFLLIPGLVEPQELFVPLLAGACGLGAGIYALWSTRKKRTARFEKAARTFLSNISSAKPTEVCFSEEGMAIGEQPLIPYADMEYFLETQSGYLLTWAKQAVFLQKKDLREADPMEFAGFIAARI